MNYVTVFVLLSTNIKANTIAGFVYMTYKNENMIKNDEKTP